MLTNHLRTIFRQLTRNKVFSFINLAGLIAGITVCLFVAQFVWFEWSFERFNVNANRTYRVNLYNTSNGVFTGISSGTVSGLAYAMEQSVPGIESIGRLSAKVKSVVTNKEKQIANLESEIVFGDLSIINLLGIELIKGNRPKTHSNPLSIFISETIALRYFGDINVVGKVLEIGFSGNNIKPFQIQGVFKDIPTNSHQRFDFMLPPQNERAWNENWAWSNVSTYLRLQQDVNLENFNNGLAEVVKLHHQDDTGDRYLLEPLTEIRLNALDGSGRSTIVNFFIALGGVILLLAWFNYVNLTTAQFFERMKEVGIRKLIGATRTQLIVQFLTESFFFNLASVLCAVILFALTGPWLTNYIKMPNSGTFLYEPLSYPILLCFVIISTLVSGCYPSLFLSSFRPLQSLIGNINNLTDRPTLRKVLIVVQLAISVILITAILAIKGQVNFMRGQNLGISIDQTLIIEAPLLTDSTTIKFEPFKNEILKLPTVTGVTYATKFPGSEIDWHRTDITLGDENADYRYNSRIIGIGTEFLDVFGLSLVSGRNFNPDIQGDDEAMLINEEACKMFGFKTFDEALNKIIFIGSRKFEVIGVLENYHYRSLQYQMQPILYIHGGYPRNPTYAVKIGSENISGTIPAIESKWKEAYTGNVFRYYFLDDKFSGQYASEEQMGSIVAGFAFLAIIICCLGLFGLSLYSVNRRTKEIGIRKVLGASIFNVVILLSSDFFRLVLIGGFIGFPFAYQGVKLWLERYAYQMPIDIPLFILPFLIVILLTFLTISFQTMAAAKTNPVDSIKYE